MITVRGQEFPDREAAARHFNTTVKHVQRFICKGKLDKLGLRTGENNAQSKPVAFAGLSWRTRTQAAADLGMGTDRLRLFLDGRMSAAQLDRFQAAVQAYKRKLASDSQNG